MNLSIAEMPFAYAAFASCARCDSSSFFSPKPRKPPDVLPAAAIARLSAASRSSSTAVFIASVLSEMVFDENELAKSPIGPKIRSMLPFLSTAALMLFQSCAMMSFLSPVAQ